jgi:cyclopropane fatty-acyl-phospholipid synthase-like methyltransferase
MMISLGRLASAVRRRISRLERELERARNYVRSDEVSGQIQFELLRREGLERNSRLLEIGCGCLNAGVPLIQYLDAGKYFGIDPNPWLREAAIKHRRVRRLILQKRPVFLNNQMFDASELGVRFDYIFAHSILSHAAHWQLSQFLENTSKVLAPNGKILASVRLAEGNSWGSAGSPDKQDSMDEEWVYPDVSWFKRTTFEKGANDLGLTTTFKPEYTRLYVARRPAEFHDWVVIRRS